MLLNAQGLAIRKKSLLKRVIIESPYAGDKPTNIRYAQACLLDCIARKEAPFASHLLYTQVLNDDIQDQRIFGLTAAMSWLGVADLVAVYTNLGISKGMRIGITRAKESGITIEMRSLTDAQLKLFGIRDEPTK